MEGGTGAVMLQKLPAAQGLTQLCPPMHAITMSADLGQALSPAWRRGMLSAGKSAGLGTCIIAQEGPLRGDGDPLPDADGLGVSWISTLRLLIKAPVPVNKSAGLWACLGPECIPHGH